MGKVTGYKLTFMKCRLDTWADVNIMPLITYQIINLSEFYKRGKSINGYGQDGTILKDHNDNPIKQDRIKVILCKWNTNTGKSVF